MAREISIDVSVPSRGLYFLNYTQKPSSRMMKCVSVPSRGLYFLNRTHIYEKKYLHMVSVPSRGLYFLNRVGGHNDRVA